MAATVYAQRCAELKARYTNNAKSKDPFFITQFNALYALANLGRLSRHNVIWLGKRIHEMIEIWTMPEQREMLDRLQERQERAWRRWEKRIAERAAVKAAGAAKRVKNKDTTESTIPAPTPGSESLW